MNFFQLTLSLSLALVLSAAAADDYKLGPDSMPQEGAPRGQVTKHPWTSKIFPGTVRDWWIYVPAQYDEARSACVMIFQDGGGYVNTNGQWRVPTVFDNLIHRKEMPVTIGVFINPGIVPPPHSNALPRFNRSYEYDGLGDQYARFCSKKSSRRSRRITTSRRIGRGALSPGRVRGRFAHSRPAGNARTRSAKCLVRSGLTLSCAAATIIPRWFARPSRSRFVSFSRTAATT